MQSEKLNIDSKATEFPGKNIIENQPQQQGQEQSRESGPSSTNVIQTGILEGINKEKLIENMDTETAKKIQSFSDKYPESDVAQSGLKSEAQSAAAKNEGVEQTGRGTMEQESKISQEELLKGTLLPEREEQLLKGMDDPTARCIQSFVDKYPNSEVAKSGLKEKAHKALTEKQTSLERGI